MSPRGPRHAERKSPGERPLRSHLDRLRILSVSREKCDSHSFAQAPSASPDGHRNYSSKLKQTENLRPGWEALLPPAKFLPAAEELVSGPIEYVSPWNRTGIEMVTSGQWARRGVSMCPAQHRGHLPWSFSDWQFRVARENLTNSPIWQGVQILNGAFLIWKSPRQRMPTVFATAWRTQNAALWALQTLPQMPVIWPTGPWQGASSSLLLLGQSSDCDLSVRCRGTDSRGAQRPKVSSLPPSPYEWKARQHCPMSQLLRDRDRHGLSWFLPSVLWTAGWLWLARFPVQKHTPVKKAWVQKKGRIHCAQLLLHRHLLGLSPN